jgi:selenium metabolism protein YedF
MKPNHNRSTVILITHNGMGKAEIELGHKLINTYLKLLTENNLLPNAICFYTEGVKLVVRGSPVIETLRSLQDKGVRLIICNSCLNFYNLVDQVEIGIVGGMPDIIEAQWQADKVITL